MKRRNSKCYNIKKGCLLEYLNKQSDESRGKYEVIRNKIKVRQAHQECPGDKIICVVENNISIAYKFMRALNLQEKLQRKFKYC